MTNKANLPVDVRVNIAHDNAVVSGLTGVPERKVGGKKGYRLPDDEERKLLDEVKFGYVKTLEMHALNQIMTPPTAEEVWASSRKKQLANALLEAAAKGNGYDKLLIPSVDKERSAIWQIALALLRDPTKYGVRDVPALMADVEFEYTGRDASTLQVKD